MDRKMEVQIPKRKTQMAIKHEKMSSLSYYKRNANLNCTKIHILLIRLTKTQKFNDTFLPAR